LRKAQGQLVFHIAEGTSDQVARRSSVFLSRLQRHGPLIGVHGIKLTDRDARYLEALVWCPVSNYFLFERTADIASLKAHTAILFGTDATMSAEGSFWDHLRVARRCGALTDEELLASVTTTAARIWRVDDCGDMVVLRRSSRDPWESLFAVQPEDVVAVVVKNRLALMSEELFGQVAPESWHDLYAAVTIGNNNVRVYSPSRSTLEALAAIGDSPVAVN
jgi:cytosine/adenosine deaminase-related metal-dependent hydrolase